MGNLPPKVCRQPPPPRRCSDGSVWDPHSNMHLISKEEGNTSMVGSLKYRTRPYYSRRCKKVSSTNIESLPDELLSDILVRLPADDIYERARVVCRRWYHIIHSDAFINTHLHHSTYGLLVPGQGMLPCSHLIYLSATEQGQIEIFDSSWKSGSTAWSSCNGLVLMLSTKRTSLYILNPATKQTFLLPPFELDSKLDCGVCGIAYSAASMEYKVVQSTITQCKPRLRHLNILTVGVDNSWRHIQVEHLSRDFREVLGFTPFITEGFMHWALDIEKVLTLNVETEIITENVAPLPQTYEDMVYLSTGRYLTLLICQLDLTWEVWEMNPSESAEWRKRTKFQFPCKHHGFIRLLGWVKYPEVLACEEGRAHKCIFYNLRTHEINDTTEIPNYISHYKGLPHRNTLVWLSP